MTKQTNRSHSRHECIDALVLCAIAMSRGLNVDEHQFVAVALLARGISARDYPFFHTRICPGLRAFSWCRLFAALRAPALGALRVPRLI